MDSLDDIADLARWLGEQPFISIDTETNGRSPWLTDFAVRLVQIGSPTMAWLLDPRRWSGVVEDIIRRWAKPIVMHNSRFDVAVLASMGITVPWRLIDDTMIAMRIAEPHLPAALKEAAGRHVSLAAKTAQADLHRAMKRNRWDWETIPLDYGPYLYYAAQDVILTSRLYRTPIVRHARTTPAYRMEMDVRAVCSRMEANGLRIDRDHCHRERSRLETEATQLTDRGISEFRVSLTSPDQIAKWMISSDARPYMTKVTKGGKPAVDEEILTRIANEMTGTDAGQLAGMTLRARKLLKISQTYLVNLTELADGDGVLHPDVETLAARTGRMSIRAPALQTLPKPAADSESRIVRQAVLPRRDGDRLVTCDLDQVEMRIAASLSRDPGLIGAFDNADRDGSDFFLQSARDIYAHPTMSKADPRRKLVKSVWYGGLYGAGAAKMAATAGVGVDTMTKLRQRITDLYPGFWRLGRESAAQAREGDGWVETVYGRRLRVDERKLYMATNYIIQGSAAEVFKRGLIYLAQAGLESAALLPVHDEVVLSVPEADVEDARRLVVTAMSSGDFQVPLTAHASTGLATWAEA